MDAVMQLPVELARLHVSCFLLLSPAPFRRLKSAAFRAVGLSRLRILHKSPF